MCNICTCMQTDLFEDDNKLSYAEYTKYDGASGQSQLTHDVYNHFDTNKDGFLQRTEYVDTLFSQMDHNGTCQLCSNILHIKSYLIYWKKAHSV